MCAVCGEWLESGNKSVSICMMIVYIYCAVIQRRRQKRRSEKMSAWQTDHADDRDSFNRHKEAATQ